MSDRTIRILASDLGFVEGPVVRQTGEIALVSIHRGLVYQITDAGTEVLAETKGFPDGLAEDADGSIYIANTGGLSRDFHKPPDGMTGGVQVIRPNGELEWCATDPISPNDLCFGPDGYLYVTDPTRWSRHGDPRWGRWDDSRLWRVDPESGEAELLVSVDWYANGIGFSIADDALFVADSYKCRIVRYSLDDGGISDPETVIQMERGHPDGLEFDVDGNIVIAAISLGADPGEIQTWSVEGELLDVFRPGDGKMYTNLALTEDRVLVLADATNGNALAVDNWPTAGLPLHPFRSA